MITVNDYYCPGKRICLHLGNIATITEGSAGNAVIHVAGRVTAIHTTRSFAWMITRWTEFLDGDEVRGNVPDVGPEPAA